MSFFQCTSIISCTIAPQYDAVSTMLGSCHIVMLLKDSSSLIKIYLLSPWPELHLSRLSTVLGTLRTFSTHLRNTVLVRLLNHKTQLRVAIRHIQKIQRYTNQQRRLKFRTQIRIFFLSGYKKLLA